MKNKKTRKEDNITRNFIQSLEEEIGYPSIASNHPIPIVGLAGPEMPSQVPQSFQGKIEIHDAVDTLFYHFDINQILDAIAQHLIVKSQGAGDSKTTKLMGDKQQITDLDNMLDIASQLKKMVGQVNNT